MSQYALELMADRRTTGETIRVFAYLCIEMDSSGYVDVTQKQIAENLGMTPAQVSRAISFLKDINAVARQYHGSKGRPMLKVSHNLAHKDAEWVVGVDGYPAG